LKKSFVQEQNSEIKTQSKFRRFLSKCASFCRRLRRAPRKNRRETPDQEPEKAGKALKGFNRFGKTWPGRFLFFSPAPYWPSNEARRLQSPAKEPLDGPKKLTKFRRPLWARAAQTGLPGQPGRLGLSGRTNRAGLAGQIEQSFLSDLAFLVKMAIWLNLGGNAPAAKLKP
jgi:hypothetical protein